MTARVLIIGGYGNFGSYITRQLVKDTNIQIIIAGRSEDKGRALASQFKTAPNPPQWLALDITHHFAGILQTIAPNIVIHTSGPFQGQGYDVAEACIKQGCHYIDLADGREFVVNITTLDEKARLADIVVVSGASSVPALTSAIIEHYHPSYRALTAVDYAISTAQRTPPGVATTAAILGYAGKPFTTLIDGRPTKIYGWQSLHSHTFPEIGRRWLGNCDIPDLSLFPQEYKDLRTIRFYAGLEVPVVHMTLWLLSWLVRFGMLHGLDKTAALLRRIGTMFNTFGSKNSAFYMHLSGTGHDGQLKDNNFTIIARSGDGPYIPCIPAIVLTRMIASGEFEKRGAFSCMKLISLEQYLEALKAMDITAVSCG